MTGICALDSQQETSLGIIKEENNNFPVIMSDFVIANENRFKSDAIKNLVNLAIVQPDHWKALAKFSCKTFFSLNIRF